MRPDRVEITQDNALERSAGIDDIGDYFLGNLLGVAVRRCRLFDWRLFGDRIYIRLSINSSR